MKVNFKISTVLLILVVGPIAAGPVADPVEIDDVEAGTRYNHSAQFLPFHIDCLSIKYSHFDGGSR